MNGKHYASIITAVLVLVVGIVFYSQLFYTVDATHIAVFQRPITGTLEVKTTPGTYLRLGSTVTTYPKRAFYSFEYDPHAGDDHSIQVRFNDGGHAQIGGNISWEMPSSPEKVVLIHTYFGSAEGVDAQLIKPNISRALYLTSPLMSSTESYAARRNDFLQLFADQLVNGVYKTESVETRLPDPITGELKTVKVVTILREKTGEPIRAERSPIGDFGINTLPPTINNIVYDPKVEEQIQEQRNNIMSIQTAQAEAKKSEQRTITTEQTGKADAMKAKWEQEVLKAKAVTEGEQQRQVAEIAAQRDLNVQTLKAQTAEQYRIEQTKIGEGDAARRQLVMQADGALQAKLDAWLKNQEAWANAFAQTHATLVPQFVTGNAQGAAGNNAALDFMSIMGMKAAKDLAFDPTVQLTAPKARPSNP